MCVINCPCPRHRGTGFSAIHWFFTIQERNQETSFETLKVPKEELPCTIFWCFHFLVKGRNYRAPFFGVFLSKRLFPDFVSLQFMCVQTVCSFVSGLISMGCQLWDSSGRATDRDSLFQLELLIGFSNTTETGKKSQKEIKKKRAYFSPGSARLIHPSAGSPLLVHHL